MRISVAMCTYNGSRFLREQLESLLAQTLLPDEIVIGDDVSTDDTLDLLEAFSVVAVERGISVRITRNERNLGFAANFDSTLSRTGGDVVFLCDQDDVWHPEKIERMCGEFASRPRLGLLHTDARLIDAEGRDMECGLFEALEMSKAEISAEHDGNAFEVLMRRNTVTGATAAIRREALLGSLPIPEGWIHDEWLALRCSLTWHVDCIEWPSIGYRQHEANQIGVRRRTISEKIGLNRRLKKRDVMVEIAERLERVLRRYDAARYHLPQSARVEMEGRIVHARFRSDLPRNPVYRLKAVFVEALSGRYRQYSSGWRSIASDLVDIN
jgi:glycosyltransferase involved in cell wall biosynthesis